MTERVVFSTGTDGTTGYPNAKDWILTPISCQVQILPQGGSKA